MQGSCCHSRPGRLGGPKLTRDVEVPYHALYVCLPYAFQAVACNARVRIVQVRSPAETSAVWQHRAQAQK